jgi:hypothetical protein
MFNNNSTNLLQSRFLIFNNAFQSDKGFQYFRNQNNNSNFLQVLGRITGSRRDAPDDDGEESTNENEETNNTTLSFDKIFEQQHQHHRSSSTVVSFIPYYQNNDGGFNFNNNNNQTNSLKRGVWRLNYDPQKDEVEYMLRNGCYGVGSSSSSEKQKKNIITNEKPISNNNNMKVQTTATTANTSATNKSSQSKIASPKIATAAATTKKQQVTVPPAPPQQTKVSNNNNAVAIKPSTTKTVAQQLQDEATLKKNQQQQQQQQNLSIAEQRRIIETANRQIASAATTTTTTTTANKQKQIPVVVPTTPSKNAAPPQPTAEELQKQIEDKLPKGCVFIFDTSSLHNVSSNLHLLERLLKYNIVIIPHIVIDELDYHTKKHQDQQQQSASSIGNNTQPHESNSLSSNTTTITGGQSWNFRKNAFQFKNYSAAGTHHHHHHHHAAHNNNNHNQPLDKKLSAMNLRTWILKMQQEEHPHLLIQSKTHMTKYMDKMTLADKRENDNNIVGCCLYFTKEIEGLQLLEKKWTNSKPATYRNIIEEYKKKQENNNNNNKKEGDNKNNDDDAAAVPVAVVDEKEAEKEKRLVSQATRMLKILEEYKFDEKELIDWYYLKAVVVTEDNFLTVKINAEHTIAVKSSGLFSFDPKVIAASSANITIAAAEAEGQQLFKRLERAVPLGETLEELEEKK